MIGGGNVRTASGSGGGSSGSGTSSNTRADQLDGQIAFGDVFPDDGGRRRRRRCTNRTGLKTTSFTNR